MRRKLTYLRGEQAQRGGRTGRCGASCVLGELAAYKRSSVRALMVSTPTTSTHPYGTCGLSRSTLSQTIAVGISRRRARASIAHNSRGLKGVMEE
jgi:hypothetical protein